MNNNELINPDVTQNVDKITPMNPEVTKNIANLVMKIKSKKVVDMIEATIEIRSMLDNPPIRKMVIQEVIGLLPEFKELLKRNDKIS